MTQREHHTDMSGMRDLVLKALDTLCEAADTIPLQLSKVISLLKRLFGRSTLQRVLLHLLEFLPHVYGSFPFHLFVEAVQAVHLRAFVIASQQMDQLRVLDTIAQE